MSVRIYVFLNDRSDHSGPAPRTATWTGEVTWPGALRPGDTWFHCSDWGAEEFDRVSFCGPEAGVTTLYLEVRTTPDVLAHLIADHGFDV